jgi:hypothetical protein
METKYLIIIAILILFLACAIISAIMLGGVAFFALGNITKLGNASSVTAVANSTCCPAFPKNNVQQSQDYRIVKFRGDLSMESADFKKQAHFYSITYLDLISMDYVHFLYNDSQSLVDTVVYANGTYYKSATVNGQCSAVAAKADFYNTLSGDSDLGDLGMFLTMEGTSNRSGGYIPPAYGQQIKETSPGIYTMVMGPHSPYNFVFKRYNGLYLGYNISIYGNGTLNYAYSGVNPVSEQDFNAVLNDEAAKLKGCKFTY